MTARPLIGLTLDAEEPGSYSKLPWYALRQNYFGAVAAAGGLPIALPHHPALADDYVQVTEQVLLRLNDLEARGAA